MFNIGPGELIVILIVALVLLGPDKLPEMARTVGKGMRELRRATEDIKDQVENELYDLDPQKPRSPILKPPPGPARAAQNAPPPAASPAVTVVPTNAVALTHPALPAAPAAVPAASTPTEPELKLPDAKS